jgi:AcrR family transcriptional regulator
MWNKNKKELIYDSWVKLFWKFWVKRVSIDMIVKDAWVAKWTFYIYYKNKGELYKKIIDDFLENWKKYISKFNNKFPDLKERFFNHMIWSLNFFEKNDIIKNIVTLNQDYFLWKINQDYLYSRHLEVIKLFFWEKFSDDEMIINIAKIKWFFLEILNYKKRFDDKNEYEIFVLDLTAILTNWLFSDYRSLYKWKTYTKLQQIK